MKSVAIIGAGPSGLIAARKLLQSGEFTVAVFEKNDQVGGSWIPEGIINPIMRTNQTRFTMSFSDLSWDSLPNVTQPAPVYPIASQVLQYLQSYFERHIPSGTVRFQTKVQRVKQVPDKDGESNHMRWELSLQESVTGGESNYSEAVFDYLVVAPGVSQVPNQFQCGMDEVRRQGSMVPVIHSTQYRALDDLKLAHPSRIVGKRRVLVVGGSHSGSDIATLIALQISDVQHSPPRDGECRDLWNHVEVVHVTRHEMFGLPSFVRDSESSTCTFQPIDFTLFNRSNRPPNPPPTFSFGLLSSERVGATRSMIRAIVNGNEGLIDTRQKDELAPYGVLSDTYSQLLQFGKITQIRGGVVKLETTNDEHVLTTIINTHEDDRQIKLENVCAVIHATGFDSPASFSFLPPEVKSALDFDASCDQVPLVLDASFLSQSSSCPTFAVVGFPGAYWGVFEMQARAIVRAWTQPNVGAKSQAQKEQHEKLLAYFKDLRQAIKQGRKFEIPHNAFGDSLGILEQASQEFNLERFDLGFSETQGFVCSSRYLDPGADKLEAMKTLTSVQSVRRKARESGAFLARAVFHGLLGIWIAASMKEGGENDVVRLEFHPRYPTDSSFDWEYIAIRKTTAETTRSVYRYSEAVDEMTTWSTQEDGFGTGPYVGTFDFNHPSQEHGKDTAVALYLESEATVTDIEGLDAYQFLFAGSTLKTFTIRQVRACDLSKRIQSLHFIRAGV